MKNKKEIQNPTYYAIIPAEVRYSNISPNAKLLFGEIMALASKEGFCWASNDYLGQLYKVEGTTISEWVKQLSDAGFITSKVTGGYKRKITVLSTLRKKPKLASGNSEAVASGKVEKSITSISNTSNIATPSKDVDNFDRNKEIDRLLNYKQYWLNIIGAFIKFKRIELSNSKQLSLLTKKYYKVAHELEAYDVDKIKRAMGKCSEIRDKKGQPYDWTLFTVLDTLLK